jgi:spore germination protein KB
MKKEIITQKQAVSMIALCAVGSSLVLGLSRNSKQDAWMAVLIAIAAVMPFLYIYARLMRRYPGKNIFDICIEVFGRTFGKIVIAFFAWYAFHLGSLVFRDFSEFIQITAFNEMPQTISLLCLAVLVIWVVRGGPETLGRWASFALPVLIAIVAATFLLLIKDMHLNYLLPVGEHLNEVPRDAFDDFAYPFAETALFLSVLNTLKPGDRPGRAWLSGILIAGAVLLFGMFFRNALVLGFPLLGNVYFPSYNAVSIIIAGNFLSRIEGVVGANLLISGFVKISVCLMTVSKGCARLFDAGDYRPFVAPLGLLMVALASIVYNSIMELFDFLPVYEIYAVFFTCSIPLALCITAEIKFIIKERKIKGGEAPA